MASSISTPLLLLLFATVGMVMTKAHSTPAHPGVVFNVMDFGAVADDKTDNAKAFLSAWNQACAWIGKGKAKVMIPRGTFLTGPVSFKGPCKGPTVFQLKGVVKAPVDLASKIDRWISFQYINVFTLTGKGKFDGQGALAWSRNECYMSGDCDNFPISLRFDFITNATIRGISSVDAKYFHINVLGCKNVNFHDIKISAPIDSANTDGIHIGRSSGIRISRSIIGTGDDCISLGDGSNDISVSNIFCGPGHGISIGSLGRYENEEAVIGVTVTNCTFSGTDNGVRIKTWPGAFSGLVSNLKFEDIVMNNVSNPVIIDQQYCPWNKCNPHLPSLVKISNVIFRNIRGTSATQEAVKLLCSEGFPCEGMELCDIDLKYSGINEMPIASTCSNAKATLSGKNFPVTTCI